MNSIDQKIAQAKQKHEQLIRQKREQEVREKKKQEALNLRRQIIIGQYVSKYFPEVLRFQPQRVNADNEVEFAPLADFLSLLSSDRQYIEQLKETVR